MKRYLTIYGIFLILLIICANRGNAQPLIGTYPPQVHQQICQESTFTRYLQVFNSGDSVLIFNAAITPDTISWVAASPLSGEIEAGDTLLIGFYFNSAGLSIDNYYADLVISSNDPSTPELSVLAMLHVQDLTIFIEPEEDSICLGCSTQLNVMVFGCSEMYNFNWASDPPGFTSTEKSPVVSPQVTTTYTVTVTDGGYSSQKSVQIFVQPSSGIPDVQYLTDIIIYPNPGQGILTVKFQSPSDGSGQLRITDRSGRIVHSEEVPINTGLNDFAFQTAGLLPGMYLLSIETKGYQNHIFFPAPKIIIK